MELEGAGEPCRFQHCKELRKIDHSLPRRAPQRFPATLRADTPLEVLDRHTAHHGRGQTSAVDPMNAAIFYPLARVLTILGEQNAARIALERYRQLMPAERSAS